jgi:hypothetical protein
VVSGTKPSPFLVPDTERIDLPDGNHLEVKTELAWGETLLLNGKLNEALTQSGDVPVHEGLRDYYLLRAALWITDWSFTDAKGNPVPWDDGQQRSNLDELIRRINLLSSLRGPVGNQINMVLNAHEAKAQEGNAPTPDETAQEMTPTDQPPPRAAEDAPTSP